MTSFDMTKKKRLASAGVSSSSSAVADPVSLVPLDMPTSPARPARPVDAQGQPDRGRVLPFGDPLQSVSPPWSASARGTSVRGNSGAAPAGSPASSATRPPVRVPRVPEHMHLCPLGNGGTRWYLCDGHGPGVVFQAGSGLLDSVANSCPLCGSLSVQFHGCACEHALHPLDRAARPGRRIRRRSKRRGVRPRPVEDAGGDRDGGGSSGQ